MAKVQTMSGIASISGRLGNYCFRTMKATGKVYMHPVASKEQKGPAKAPSAAMVARLEAVLGEPVGMKGLNILLYGWKKARKYGATYCQVLTNRNWMYITEVMDFSEYAGYDLSKNTQECICESESLRM